MSALTDAKNAIKSILTPLVPNTYTYVNARPVPPCVTIYADSPYLSQGVTFGTFTLGLNLQVMAPTKANDVITEELDTLIDDIVVALVNSGYGVDQVSAPFVVEANNAQYAAVDISISTNVSL